MVKNEIWKIVDGYENYQISNNGRVKSIEREVNYWRGGKRIKKEKILKPDVDKDGYLVVTLFDKNIKRKRFRIHRLVALAFIPNPENKETVNHEDGNKNNNCISNLTWQSNIENQQHAWKNGLKKGKLTKNQVRVIKDLLKNTTLNNTEISKLFNVDPSVISNIKLNKIWKNV